MKPWHTSGPTSCDSAAADAPHPDMRTIVQAGARLHLGFLDLNGACGRRYGSIGVTLERPRCTVEAAPAEPGTVVAAERTRDGHPRAPRPRRRNDRGAARGDDPGPRGVRRGHPGRPGGRTGGVAGRGPPGAHPRAGAPARPRAALRDRRRSVRARRARHRCGASGAGGRPGGGRGGRRAGAPSGHLPALPARRLALRPRRPHGRRQDSPVHGRSGPSETSRPWMRSRSAGSAASR